MIGPDAVTMPPHQEIGLRILSKTAGRWLVTAFQITTIDAPRSAARRRGNDAETSPAALPRVEGAFVTSEEPLRAASVDWGHSLERVPPAVLRPGSIDDVVRVVRYADRHGVPLAMRGRRHCAYGQAQVARGIVIDSSTLTRMHWEGREFTVEAGPSIPSGLVSCGRWLRAPATSWTRPRDSSLVIRSGLLMPFTSHRRNCSRRVLPSQLTFGRALICRDRRST